MSIDPTPHLMCAPPDLFRSHPSLRQRCDEDPPSKERSLKVVLEETPNFPKELGDNK